MEANLDARRRHQSPARMDHVVLRPRLVIKRRQGVKVLILFVGRKNRINEFSEIGKSAWFS
jgi:hypothetical protein